MTTKAVFGKHKSARDNSVVRALIKFSELELENLPLSVDHHSTYTRWMSLCGNSGFLLRSTVCQRRTYEQFSANLWLVGRGERKKEEGQKRSRLFTQSTKFPGLATAAISYKGKMS